MSIIEGHRENIEELINNNEFILLEFWGPNCRSCRAMEPAIKKIDNSLGNKVVIVKINAEEEQDLVEDYSIQGAPTFVFLKNGNELDRKIGYVQPFELRSWLEEMTKEN